MNDTTTKKENNTKIIGTIPCECCGKEPGKIIKGGVINGVHGLWLVGDTCLLLLKDRRK